MEKTPVLQVELIAGWSLSLTVEQINFAIQDCMSECALSANPLTCLAGFLEQLRGLREWPEADIHKVDKAVRHLLVPVIAELHHPTEGSDVLQGKGWAAAFDAVHIRPR